MRQGKDISIAQAAGNQELPDRNYFWRQLSLPHQPVARKNARKIFVKALKKNAKFNQGCTVVQIPTAEQLTLQLASTEAIAVVQEPTL